MRASDLFFRRMDELCLALTFDDVRLKTGYADFFPREVSLETKFSRNVPLKIPVVSAAMDTVTEHRMAIAIARLGGIGVVHRNLAPREQKSAVQRVKYYLSRFINKPVTVQDTETIAEVLKRCETLKSSFRSFPVLDANGKLVGIITQNDFDFCMDSARRVADVMTKDDLVTALEGETPEGAFLKMSTAKKKVLPVLKADGSLGGMYLYSDLLRGRSVDASMYNVDSQGRLRVGIAVGVYEDALSRVGQCQEYIDVAVIDSSHGDCNAVIETVQELKKKFPRIDVVAGNVSEGESVRRLVYAGADGVKVGQGPGSICTTRRETGCGAPQVSAVYHGAQMLERIGALEVPLNADGGIVNPGDIPIAIGAGAHTVMLGSVIAGTEEACGEIDYTTNTRHYRGMGSLQAMKVHRGSRERYGDEGVPEEDLFAQGIPAEVPFSGKLETVLKRYMGGLKHGMGLVGARTIEELRQKADFHRITGAGVRESHPHNVHVVQDYGSGGR